MSKIMSFHIERKEYEEYENLGFELTYLNSKDRSAEPAPSADEVFEVKYRVPSFVLSPEVFQNISSKTMNDEFYDDSAIYFGENTTFHRQRKIHGEQDELIYSVKQQHHQCYYKEPCCKLPKKLVLSYSFTRKEITEDETVRVYLDQVFFPVKYEVVTFSSRRKMQNADVKQQITDIVNEFMRLSRQSEEEGRGTITSLLNQGHPDFACLFSFHFFPLFTKCMYVLQCVDADLYREVCQKHDRLFQFAHKRAEESIKNNTLQKDPLLKRYLWSVCVYPCNVYSKLNIGYTFSETLQLNKGQGFEEIMDEMEIEGDFFNNSTTAGIDIWDNES
jgi:hypothetical protein